MENINKKEYREGEQFTSFENWNFEELAIRVLNELPEEDQKCLERYIPEWYMEDIIWEIIVLTESKNKDEAIENIRLKLRKIRTSSIPNKAVVQLTLKVMEEMKSSDRTKKAS